MERRQAGNPSCVARYTNVSGLQTCDATTIDRDAKESAGSLANQGLSLAGIFLPPMGISISQDGQVKGAAPLLANFPAECRTRYVILEES